MVPPLFKSLRSFGVFVVCDSFNALRAAPAGKPAGRLEDGIIPGFKLFFVIFCPVLFHGIIQFKAIKNLHHQSVYCMLTIGNRPL